MSTQLAIPGSKDFEKPVPFNAGNMLQIALQNNAAIDVIERLVALQEKAEMRQAEAEFNLAMNACQAEIKSVVPDAAGKHNKKYSTYKALDAEIRPVYLRHGLSLSFDAGDCPNPEKVRVVCIVSRGIYNRRYQIDITPDGSGPKGNSVLTKTDADLAANSIGKRRLLRNIFNIVDNEDETLTNGWLMEQIDWIKNCRNADELKRVFGNAFKEAKAQKAANAMLTLVEARDLKAKEF
jgi:hypothetical protein